MNARRPRHRSSNTESATEVGGRQIPPVESSHARIRAVVLRIPRGRVATYGQVAALAGLPGQARLVGYALHALPEASGVPWQRVVNARGEVSPRSDPAGHEALQRVILQHEGVRFDNRGRISLAKYQWQPRTRLRAVARKATKRSALERP